jgi:hypothetical protein
MKIVALTGHTRGLGKHIYNYLVKNNYSAQGFSFSTGCDLRDYSQVGAMIKSVKSCDWFINCAHPDYCQTQILYRLLKENFKGKILNIGSPVVHRPPDWTDLDLLEYVTQKTALYHAHQTLDTMFPNQLILWEPDHDLDENYIVNELKRHGL